MRRRLLPSFNFQGACRDARAGGTWPAVQLAWQLRYHRTTISAMGAPAGRMDRRQGRGQAARNAAGSNARLGAILWQFALLQPGGRSIKCPQAKTGRRTTAAVGQEHHPVSKRGRHTSLDKSLKTEIRWLESHDIVQRLIIGRSET